MNTLHKIFFKSVRMAYTFFIFILILGLMPLSSQGQNNDQYKDFGHDFARRLNNLAYIIPQGGFTANWKSLDKHTVAPEWFRDAKFGIYTTWGVFTVPAFYNGWYPCWMYDTSSIVYKHHVKVYGSPLKFGYPDFVPMFKAQYFNAKAWARLFKESGARFAGPVAEHHDGFAMWKTSWTPWNAYDMGPHQDIVGELAKAIRKQGMKFLVTFHAGRNELWKDDGQWIGHYQYVKKYFPSLLNNPKQAIMYGYLPRKVFLEKWRGELEELVNNYHPDMMWFDGQTDLVPDSVIKKYLAFYFNKADQEDKQVVVTAKYKEIPLGVAIQDFERGRANRLMEIPWLTDDAIGNNAWSFVQGLQLKASEYIIHELIDIVSKNGDLLLNISPKSDGTIPEEQQKILLNIGRWLKQNGEAIYGTRPWRMFGEGPTRLEKGGAFTKDINYTSQDIRYTRKEDTIYAIEMGWPGLHQKILLASWHRDLHWGTNIKIKNISVLGSDEQIQWTWPAKGLIITTPSKAPNDVAIVFRIITRHY